LSKPLSREQLMNYARSGAQARIAELRAELEKLETVFGGSVGGARVTRSQSESGARKVKRRRRKMSPEARKKIGDAARKRWAKWRTEKKADKK
jgi:hypothetical protein